MLHSSLAESHAVRKFRVLLIFRAKYREQYRLAESAVPAMLTNIMGANEQWLQ